MAKTNVISTILDVNSLFTGIVFLGISLNTEPSSGSSKRCAAGPEVAKKLVMFEIISFSCFLFSTLAVQGLKIQLNLIASESFDGVHAGRGSGLDDAHAKMLNYGVAASGIGTLLGFLFLMISMVHVIEIRLGLVSCGDKYSISAVLFLFAAAFLGFATFLVYVIDGYRVIGRRPPPPQSTALFSPWTPPPDRSDPRIVAACISPIKRSSIYDFLS